MQHVFRKLKRNTKKGFSNLFNRIAWIIKMAISLIFIFLIVLFLIAKPPALFDQPMNENTNITADLSKEEFIAEISPVAQEVAQSHGVRPSVLVAQAALESNWGKSQLAQESNNYFGIKNPKGKEYATREYGESGWTETNASFKQYNSLHESVLDYADLMRNGTSWNQDLYRKVIEADSYQEAAIALNEAGYATDPDYASKLIRLIEQYHLYEIDK